MAKNSVRDFDATAANNTDIQSVNIAEGCAPSGINNAIRELMADIKDVSAGTVALESPQADSMTVTGDLTVDTNTLFVDASEDAVGIGTTTPVRKFHVHESGSGANGYIHLTNDNTGATTTDGFSILNSGANGRVTLMQRENEAMIFSTNATERMRIDSSGNLGIGATPNSYSGFTTLTIGGSGASDLDFEHNGTVICSLFTETSDFNISATNDLVLQTGGSNDRVRLKDDGKLLVAKSTSNTATAGIELRENGQLVATLDGGTPAIFNRLTDDGPVIKILQAGATDGQINVKSGDILIGTGSCALRFGSTGYLPSNVTTNGLADNTLDIGSGAYRYDDIFATNTTIQTSDQNEKQQIASLTDAEITAAKAISKLFKTFKWNDAVAAKGDDARTHTGHVAQEVQSAMNDAGLDVTKYAFWCSDTWWEHLVDVPAVEAVEAVTETQTDDDGNEVEVIVQEAVEAQDAFTRVDAYYTADEAPEGATQRTRLGIRYPQLLAFIGAATEQRLTSIEARLTALEG